ncbi:MAG: cobalt transporter [marine bacterium B5-7]|nr:MAG: cobalt transporter [marine bacterium B5-7]
MFNPKDSLRHAVALVAIINLAYFGIEFTVALNIQSVSLFADSIDFLEDAAVNLLILVAIGWSFYKRSIVGMLLAAILLAPGIATLWVAWEKIDFPIPPDPMSLGLTALGALMINILCAFILARFRHHRTSIIRAAYLSARNDAIANIAIIAAGIATVVTVSVWPDVIAGLGIFVMNLDAAREVFLAARAEHAAAKV